MVFANKFDCHSPVPVQNPVQVQGSTSKEDVGGTVTRNWECDRQEKRREQAHVRIPDTVGTTRASGALSSTRKCVLQLAADYEVSYRLRQHGAYFEPIYACVHTISMSSSL